MVPLAQWVERMSVEHEALVQIQHGTRKKKFGSLKKDL